MTVAIFKFLGGEPLTALRAPPSEDGTPGTGPHTKPEAMRLCALTVVWLECALHGNDSLRPVKVEGRQRSSAEMAPKHRWYGPAKAGVNATGGTMRRRDLPRRIQGLPWRVRLGGRKSLPAWVAAISRSPGASKSGRTRPIQKVEAVGHGTQLRSSVVHRRAPRDSRGSAAEAWRRGPVPSRHRRVSSLGDNDGDELLTGGGQVADAPWNDPSWGRRGWLSPAGS